MTDQSICAFLLIQLILRTALAATNLAAPENLNANKDLETLAHSVASTKSRISESEGEKRKVLATLFHINQRMKKIIEGRRNISDQLIQVEANIQLIAKRVNQLDLKISKQRDTLKKRIRSMSKIAGEGWLAILFSNSNSTDFDSAVRVLRTVADRDRKLILDFGSSRQQLEAKREQLRMEVRRLMGLRKNYRSQETELAAEHQSKSRVISEIDRTTIEQMNKIRVLRERTGRLPTETTEVDRSLSEMLRPSLFEQKGRLPPPVVGTLAQNFGLLIDPTYRVNFPHKGWLIEAEPGTPVNAVFDGTISFVGWLAGYGNTVLIDHGDNYHTVYARLKKPAVKVGQLVRRLHQIGQVDDGASVGTVFELGQNGIAPSRAGKGIYFELRHFSEPENPEFWIDSRDLNVAVAHRENKQEKAIWQ